MSFRRLWYWAPCAMMMSQPCEAYWRMAAAASTGLPRRSLIESSSLSSPISFWTATMPSYIAWLQARSSRVLGTTKPTLIGAPHAAAPASRTAKSAKTNSDNLFFILQLLLTKMKWLDFFIMTHPGRIKREKN